MNTEAKNSITMCKEALQTAQRGLQDAANEVENTNMKNRIIAQLNEVTNYLQECDKITASLSQ